jgi:hypothetical protein
VASPKPPGKHFPNRASRAPAELRLVHGLAAIWRTEPSEPGGCSLAQAKPGATLLAEVSDESRALRPDDKMEGPAVSLVARDGFLVATGTEPFDAVEVIMATRAVRDDDLSPRRTP